MSLTGKQKSALKIIIVLLCTGCFLGGISYFVHWADETASVQKYCSGSTLITITTDHGGTTGFTVKHGGCAR